MSGIGLDVTGRLIGLLAVFSPQRGRSDDSEEAGATVGVRIDHLEVSMSAAVYADFLRRLHAPAAAAIDRALQRNVRKFCALAIDEMPEAGPESPAAIFRRLVDHVAGKCSSCEAWQPLGDAAVDDELAGVAAAAEPVASSTAIAALPECLEQYVAHGIHDAVCGVARVDRDADRQLWARCLALRPWISAAHFGLPDAWLPSADALASIHAAAAAGDEPRMTAADPPPVAAPTEPSAVCIDASDVGGASSSDCGAAACALLDEAVDASDKDAAWLAIARTLRAVPALRSPREKVEALVFVNRLLSHVHALHVATAPPPPPPIPPAIAVAMPPMPPAGAPADELPVAGDTVPSEGGAAATTTAESASSPPESPGFADIPAAAPTTPRRPAVAPACTADDLVPALALALAHCCPPSFASSLSFVAAYRHEEKLRGEAGFVATLAQSACHVVVSMDASTTPGWIGGDCAWQKAVVAVESALAARWLPPPDAESRATTESAGSATGAAAAAVATPLGSDGGGGAFSPLPAAAAPQRDAVAAEPLTPQDAHSLRSPALDVMPPPPPPLPLQLSRFPLQRVPLSGFAAALVPPVVAMSDDHLPEALTAWLADRTALSGLAAAPASSLTLQDVRHLQEEYCHLAATVTSLYALLAEHGRLGAAPRDGRGEVVDAEVEAREEADGGIAVDLDGSVEEVQLEAGAAAAGAASESAPAAATAGASDHVGSTSSAYDDV